jgi:predicted nucleotidyltransferase
MARGVIVNLQFPTALHQQVAEMARSFFAEMPQVDTVLVVNSCARGQATADSDLDMAILMQPDTPSQELRDLETHWLQYAAAQPIVAAFKQHSRFSAVHLDLIDGRYVPTTWDDGGGPDGFEIGIGNHIAYAAPLGAPGPYFRELQSQWLPYYADDLRRQRLEMVGDACVYDLEHVPYFIRRGLYFQAFDRLYKAFQEFLQAVFIARRTYPVAYNKWIREQIVNWLGLAKLYAQLPPILSVSALESAELELKAQALLILLQQWATD